MKDPRAFCHRTLVYLAVGCEIMHCMETFAPSFPSRDGLALVTCVWSFEVEAALSHPSPPPLELRWSRARCSCKKCLNV